MDQSRWMQNSTPLPHQDFEPYLSQYSEYDSILDQGLSNTIHDLDIQPSLSSGNGYYSESSNNHQLEEMTNFDSHMTVKPSTLAKYSKMMNLNNFAATSETLNQQSFPLTPAASPMKSAALANDTFLQPANNNNAKILKRPANLQLTPTTPRVVTKGHSGGSASQRHQGGLTTPSSPLFNLSRHQQPEFMTESDSEYFSESAFSPSMDNVMEMSPEINQPSQFASNISSRAATAALDSSNANVNDYSMGAINVFSSLDMGLIDPKAAIAWQPVLTAPSNDNSQEIIRNQQLSLKPSNRKSCLPPGKVDSYMAGPNEEGLFECLFPNCGKFFRRRYNVRSHIQTHLCDRPYACEVCGACFVRPHDLRRHSRCHQNERPYSCPCGKAFTRHDALHRHRIRMICIGGIEIPGKPKRVPAKRGRPRKKNPTQSPPSNDSDSEQSSSSPYTSSEHEIDYYVKADMGW